MPGGQCRHWIPARGGIVWRSYKLGDACTGSEFDTL